MKQYIIVRHKKQYEVYDIFKIEVIDNDSIKIRKDNKVFIESTYEEIDDYFVDIGAITHFETTRKYLGKLVFETDNLIELINKYNELVKGKE